MVNNLRLRLYDTVAKKLYYINSIDYESNSISYVADEQLLEVSIDDVNLMFPTGVYDSNNRPIYEGDVITYQESSFSSKKTAAIIYENGCFLCKQLFSKEMEARIKKENLDEDSFKELLYVATCSSFKPIKIIGNIFTFKTEKSKKRAFKKHGEEVLV